MINDFRLQFSQGQSGRRFLSASRSRRSVLTKSREKSVAEQDSSTFITKEARRGLFGKASEQLLETEAKVSGVIPQWLKGALIVNGGGDYRGMKHMFDGYAMVSKVRFGAGKVYASQRYVDSVSYKHFESTGGEMLFREFSTPVTSPSSPALLTQASETVKLMARMATGQDAFTDNASVNIVPLPDQSFLAVSEGRNSVYRMDSTTLKTFRRQSYNDRIPGDLTTAHFKTLPDGTLVNFTRAFPLGGYHVYKMDPVTLSRTEIAFIPDRNPASPAWVHDFAVSENFLIIVETPMFVNVTTMTFGIESEWPFSMEWKPEEGTRIYAVPLNKAKDGSDLSVLTYSAPPFFFFHAANAFEEDGSIHVDLAAYDNPSILNDLNLSNIMEYPGKDISRSSLRRLSLPLNASSSEPCPVGIPRPLLNDEGKAGFFSEFNTVNPLKRGFKHRYVWGLGAQRPTNLGNSLVKIDCRAGEAILWHEPGSAPLEPSFIPSPSTNGEKLDEDDGVIVSIVMSASGSSYVLVLDSASLREVGRAPLPFAIPYRFHGAFMNI